MYMILSYSEVKELDAALSPIAYMDPVFAESMVPVFDQIDEALGHEKSDTHGYFYGGGHIDMNDEQYNLIIVCTDFRPATGPFGW